VLKQLQELPAWQGHVLHQALATYLPSYLRSKRAIDWNQIRNGAVDIARRQFAFSEARRYRDASLVKSRLPLDYCALAGHERDPGLSDNALADALDEMNNALVYLARQTDFIRGLQAGGSHRFEEALHFRVEGAALSAMAQVDLLFFRGLGEATIVDWKVGNSQTADYTRQLHVYALALLRCGQWPAIVSPERIQLFEANLLHQRIVEHRVTNPDIEAAEDFVFTSMVEMESIAGNVDYDTLSIADFDVANNPTNCGYCPFRGPCAAESSLVAERLQPDLFA